MKRIRRVSAAAALCAAAYAAWPYVSVFRLAEAIRHGDARSLEALVEWDSVREGIKEDICDTVFDEPTAKVASSDSALPPFGYSFVRGIAADAVDSNVNPQALVSFARPSGPAARRPAPDADPRLAWAFFDSPTSFSVWLRPPGSPSRGDLIRIQLELRGGGWKVTRAWLPRAILAQANSRT